jgi:hypothetical protein
MIAPCPKHWSYPFRIAWAGRRQPTVSRQGSATIEEETWNDNSMQFRVSALGQAASGKVDVLDDHVRLEVTLPWLLAKFAETIAPVLRKEGKLLLEKK